MSDEIMRAAIESVYTTAKEIVEKHPSQTLDAWVLLFKNGGIVDSLDPELFLQMPATVRLLRSFMRRMVDSRRFDAVVLVMESRVFIMPPGTFRDTAMANLGETLDEGAVPAIILHCYGRLKECLAMAVIERAATGEFVKLGELKTMPVIERKPELDTEYEPTIH